MNPEFAQSKELRVLVVDDNLDAATSLTYLLQILGCKTAVAFGGLMALRVAQLFQPALVFLDLDMPGPDGCEVLAQIRQMEGPVSDALFVCLTGRDDPSDEERCRKAGFDRFVSKPIEPELLQAVLAQAASRVGRADTNAANAERSQMPSSPSA